MLFCLVLALGLPLAACGGDGPNPGSAPYVASRNGEPFHVSSCRWVKRVLPKNLRTFESRADAMQAGHRACKTCKP